MPAPNLKKKEQAKMYLKYMKAFKDNASKREEEVYAVNKEWLNKWKQSIDYTYHKRLYHPEIGDPDYAPSDIDLAPMSSEVNAPLAKGGDFLDKAKHPSIKLVCKELKDLFKREYQIDSFKLAKKKTEQLPYGTYPIEKTVDVVKSIDSFKCVRPLIESRVSFAHYSNQSFKEIEGLIRRQTGYAHYDLSFWKYIPDEKEKDVYTREYIPFDAPLTQVSSTDKVVCEYKEKPDANASLRSIAYGNQGKIGLQNLGNTCYMDSALQCLSNCDLLTEYFLKYYTEAKVNRMTRDGTMGKLTEAYRSFLQNLWKSTSSGSSYAPKDFKREIGAFNETFQGYGQQDSFELLSYALNGIHEDLNLITTPISKPMAIPHPDSNDKVLVKYKWIKVFNMKQSVIIDLFYGLYKSVIYCPMGCRLKVFETFHAFQLPLNVYFITFVFVYHDLSLKPIELKIPFETDKNFGHLRREVSELFEVKEDSFVFAYGKGGSITQLNSVEKVVRKEATVYCYQIDPELTHDVKKAQTIRNKSEEAIEAILKKVFTNVSYRERKVISFDSMQNTDEPLRVLLDNHYNLDNGYVLLILNLPVGWSSEKLQRVLFIDRTQSLSQLSETIRSYLKPIGLFAPESFEVSLMLRRSCALCKDATCRGCNFANSRFNLKDYPLWHFITCSNYLSVNAYLYIDEEERPYVSQEQYDAYEIDVTFASQSPPSQSLFTPERIYLPNEESSYHLEYCIKQFHTVNFLRGQWRCTLCLHLGLARKGMYVYSASKYLILQMKRFKEDLSSKYEQLITFPINGFDLSPYVVEKGKNMVYDLICVINHYGSFYSGHYTAYAKNCIDHQWREFNDSHVSPMSESEVITRAAYVLFYKRRDIEKEQDKEALLDRSNIIDPYPFLYS